MFIKPAVFIPLAFGTFGFLSEVCGVSEKIAEGKEQQCDIRWFGWTGLLFARLSAVFLWLSYWSLKYEPLKKERATFYLRIWILKLNHSCRMELLWWFLKTKAVHLKAKAFGCITEVYEDAFLLICLLTKNNMLQAHLKIWTPRQSFYCPQSPLRSI